MKVNGKDYPIYCKNKKVVTYKSENKKYLKIPSHTFPYFSNILWKIKVPP
jgi:hypothetical protein